MRHRLPNLLFKKGNGASSPLKKRGKKKSIRYGVRVIYERNENTIVYAISTTTLAAPPPFFSFVKSYLFFSQQPICTFLLAEQIGLYFDGLFFHLPFGSYRGSAMTCMAKNRKKKEIETSPSTGLFPFRTCSVSLPFVLVNSLSCVTSN